MAVATRSPVPLRVSPAGESVGAFCACAVASVLASWRLLRPDVLSGDALVHLYWMWHDRDPGLFNDPLTAELRHSARYPDGYRALLWLATQVADPIAFAEWLGIGLMALSGWLVFEIVREHTAWRPAAWIGAGLFLAPIEIHRFYGGFPRAFVQPVVLLTVLLAIRRRPLAAALCAAGGALFYPPAAALAVGVLFVSSVRHGPRLDRRRVAFAALALALTAAAVLGPELAAGGTPHVLTAAQARGYPEFGEHGPVPFFTGSVVQYLSQNRSGFDLRTSGSILVLAALALLLARPRTLRLLRAEVLALPVVALALYALATAVLFRLYLPHRYTYPLIPFCAIALAVGLQPAWTALGTGRWRTFALLGAPLAVCAFAIYAFPLAPAQPVVAPLTAAALAGGTLALALLLRPGVAAGALLSGVLLIAAVALLPGHFARGNLCPKRPVSAYLATLPKDAIIAGDPRDVMCIPATARRAVVISTQLAPSYEVSYFRDARRRMFDDLRAYYGSSPAAIAELATRYGATDLLVKRDAIRRELSPARARWRSGQLPYGAFVRRLLRHGEPATLHLPPACRRWSRGPVEVYDIRCVRSRYGG